jgi:hypothetical protein
MVAMLHSRRSEDTEGMSERKFLVCNMCMPSFINDYARVDELSFSLFLLCSLSFGALTVRTNAKNCERGEVSIRRPTWLRQ